MSKCFSYNCTNKLYCDNFLNKKFKNINITFCLMQFSLHSLLNWKIKNVRCFTEINNLK